MAPEVAIDVASWLHQLGLAQYEATFRKNDVDGDVLPHLTAEDLTTIGVTSVGHRRKLLFAIAGLSAEAAAPVGTGTQAPATVSLPASAPVQAEAERRPRRGRAPSRLTRPVDSPTFMAGY